jgi:hypothetical protein
MASPSDRSLSDWLFGTSCRRSRHRPCTAVCADSASVQHPGKSDRTTDRKSSSRCPYTGTWPNGRRTGQHRADESKWVNNCSALSADREFPGTNEAAKWRSGGNSSCSIREGRWCRCLPARRGSDRAGETEAHSFLCNQSRPLSRGGGGDWHSRRVIECEPEPPSLRSHPQMT